MKNAKHKLTVFKAMTADMQTHPDAYSGDAPVGMAEASLVEATGIPLDDLCDKSKRTGVILEMVWEDMVRTGNGSRDDRFGCAWLTESGKRLAQMFPLRSTTPSSSQSQS